MSLFWIIALRAPPKFQERIFEGLSGNFEKMNPSPTLRNIFRSLLLPLHTIPHLSPVALLCFAISMTFSSLGGTNLVLGGVDETSLGNKPLLKPLYTYLREGFFDAYSTYLGTSQGRQAWNPVGFIVLGVTLLLAQKRKRVVVYSSALWS